MELKKHKWMVNNENFQGNTLKEHFKATLKELIKEIKNNKSTEYRDHLLNL